MLGKRKSDRGPLGQLLDDPRIRQAMHESCTLYAASDLVAILCDSEQPAGLWKDLQARDRALAEAVRMVTFDGVEMDALDVAGVVRLIQAIDSPRANRIKSWIVGAAIERLEEADDPELTLLRTRQAYEQRGYSRQWIDQRMRSVSARHELTSEWYRRGVHEGEQFRALTNEMTRVAFGFDVEGYRRSKGLFRTGQNLRDHMNDLELSLLALAETTAVELARQRRSHGFDALLLDAKETGQIVAKAREEIEQRTGRAVVAPMNHLPARQPTSNLAA
jgi:hypothetical protein